MNILYGVARQHSSFPEDDVYAGRLAANLWALGCRGELASLEQSEFVTSLFGRQSCNLFHAFHAVQAGAKAATLAAQHRVPFVVTCTGLDLLVPTTNPAHKEQIIEALSAADHIVLPFPALLNRLHGIFPHHGKVSVIPKGVHARKSSTKLDRREFGIAEDEVLIILIGDIEPIKNQMFALTNLKPIHEKFSNVRVVLLGQIQDEPYGQRITEFLDQNPWVSIFPMPSREKMPAWYEEAAIIINVSHAEGGYQPFLEAMATGVPAVAAQIPGNWSFMRSEEAHPNQGTGLIFPSVPAPDGFWRIHDSEGFQTSVLRLLEDSKFGKALGKRARMYMQSTHRPQLEAFLHLKVYESILENQ